MVEIVANFVGLMVLVLIVSMWFVILKFILIPILLDYKKNHL